MTQLYYSVFETGAGWMGLLASDAGIMRGTLPLDGPAECAVQLGNGIDRATPDRGRLEDLVMRLLQYFDGQAVDFCDVQVDIEGSTEFHRRAWEACRRIPRGETRTYTWLAEAAGRPSAARAAGQAMARNRVPIIVPCHRVVGADGDLRGFGSGQKYLELKRRLLTMEGAAQPQLL